MTTDNEITKGDVPAYMNDTLRLFYAELPKGETDYVGMLTRLAVIIDNKARADQFHRDIDEVVSIKDAKADTAKQIFAVLDNLHIVENWSTQKGKGIPLLLKQIGAYKDVKKKFGVLK